MTAAPVNITRNASQGVREDTAELASWALSDIASNRSEHSPSRKHTSSTAHPLSYLSNHLDQGDLTRHESNSSSRPEAIQEVSEPTSPGSPHSSQQSERHSALTELIRNSPPTEEDSAGIDEDKPPATAHVHPVTVREGIISQPSERTTLMGKRNAYGSIKDLEGQQVARFEAMNRIRVALQRSKAQTARIVRIVSNPKSWDRHGILEYGIRQPAKLMPAVILGLLLNILDALSYGEPQDFKRLSEQIADLQQARSYFLSVLLLSVVSVPRESPCSMSAALFRS